MNQNFDHSIESFIKNYVKDLRENKAAIFRVQVFQKAQDL
jgi:menaquinone-dependent protoporphyrinogen IX oxidase